jgi:hypothetical protein
MNKSNFKQPDVPDFIQKIFLTQKHFQKIPSGFDSEKIPSGFDSEKIPSGFDSEKIPSGFDSEKIPSVEKISSTDNINSGFDSEKIQFDSETMLTKDVYNRIVAKLNYNSPLIQESIVVQQQPTKKPDFLIPQKRNTRFYPQFNDSIFWCMYVRTYGESLYQTSLLLKTNMTNLMMSEKKLMSDHFNKNSDKLLKNTNHKITLATAVELKSNLMTKPYMSNYAALIPCCLFFKCPIYVINEKTKTYLFFQPNDYERDEDTEIDDPNVVVLYSEKGRVSLETDPEEKKTVIASLNNNYFKLDQYDKPLMSISNYKTEELQQIYTILFGDCPKLKKQEYYEKIVEKCAVHLLEKLI